MKPADKIFVTGATGFIGTRLVQALIDRGHQVRALTRRDNPQPPPGFDANGSDAHRANPFEHERVELVRGNITDADSLVAGMTGCSHVFHLAAYAKNWAPDRRIYFDMNVQAVRNVFEAARQHNVCRVVWTSTVMTLGPTPPGVIGDEAMPRTTDRYYTEYEETKSIAEREVTEAAVDGFPVVIVNPTRVFGPGQLTEGNAVAKLIDDYDRGRVPVLLNRGVNVGNYVLVDDVVEGHLLAMEKGRVGERYLLGGDNVSLREFFEAVARVTGRRRFQMPILKFGPMAFAHVLKKRAQWFGVYPKITPGWVRTFLVDWAYSSEKARRELGYEPASLEDGIRTTYEWLRQLRETR